MDWDEKENESENNNVLNWREVDVEKFLAVNVCVLLSASVSRNVGPQNVVGIVVVDSGILCIFLYIIVFHLYIMCIYPSLYHPNVLIID